MFFLVRVVSYFTVIELLLSSSLSIVHSVLPHIVILLVETSHMVVNDWVLAGSGQYFFGVLKGILIFARRSHLDHVNYVLCLWVFPRLKR